MQIRCAEAADEEVLADEYGVVPFSCWPCQRFRWNRPKNGQPAAADRMARAIRDHDVWVAVEEAAIGWVEVDRDRVAALYVSPSCSRQGLARPFLHSLKPPYVAPATRLRVSSPARTR